MVAVWVGCCFETDFLVGCPRTTETWFGLVFARFKWNSFLLCRHCFYFFDIFFHFSFHLCVAIHYFWSCQFVGGALGREWKFGFLCFAEKAIKNNIIVILRNEARETVMFLQESNQLLRGSIIGQFFGTSILIFQNLLKDFLNLAAGTLPSPLRWHD